MRRDVRVELPMRIGNVGEVFRRRLATDAPVGAAGQGRLVEDRVVAILVNPLVIAPLLRKDVVDVETVPEIRVDVGRLARRPVPGAFLQQKGVDPFVGRTLAGTEGVEPGGGELGVGDGPR